MTAASTGPDVTGGSLIIMAGMFPTMTDAQREGRACPWCNVEVTAETGIDLGRQDLPRFGASTHPVACRACAHQQAMRTHAHHCRTCAKCAYDEHCPDKLALRRLALETRPAAREEHG